AIRMPEEVPPNISQAFTDVIPFAIAVVIAYGIDIAIRAFTGVSFAQAIIQMFQPLFTAADGYVGIAIIYGAIGFFWFIGIHGPSIVEPAITAIAFLNMDANLALIQGGEHAANIITPGLQYFVATLGGTGATFVVPYLFMWFGKSKQNKAVGKASFIPTSFGVNEPILFGGPLVLNPVFFVPFVLAPILNVWIFK
ncbi:PTS transporter subunit EIIC, partial [Aerococcus urinaeequi]